MKNEFPGGVWPVMLTPFKEDGKVDYPALDALVEWYIGHGVKGLFAVCQSGEMFFLTLKERIAVAKRIVKKVRGRIPVIASGHISDSFADQVAELNAMSETGVDAVILITNRLAAEGEKDSVWTENCRRLLKEINPDIPLGLYECPYPYKRVLTPDMLYDCAKSGRFYFLKDTCCDISLIRRKLKAIRGTELKLYNANTSTLLASLRSGATGYSGVMANFQPDLYAFLCEHSSEKSREIRELADFLTISSFIERQCYPVNAKYFLQHSQGLPVTTFTRSRNRRELIPVFRTEVDMLDELTETCREKYLKGGRG